MPATSAALVLVSATAIGQPAAPVSEDAGWSASVNLSVSHLLAFETDIDASDASVTTNSTRFGGGITWTSPDRKAAIGLALRGGITEYDIDNGDTILAGLDDDPFETFYRQRIEVTGRYAFNETWGFFGSGGVESSYESGADFGDGVQVGGTALALWTNSTGDLTFGFGLAAFSRLDEDALVIPVASVRWQIDDRLRLESERLGLALTYEPSDEWAFSILGRYDRVEFRLDENNSAASEGVLKDNRVVVGARASWMPAGTPGLELSLTAGAMVYREFELLDDDGDDVFEEDADPSAYLGFRLSYRF